ncbi:MAG: adenine deaminase C-terminal domain-containing protein, partial [Dehalococcoidia bacterium]
MNTALGNEKADLVITNGDLINVYTGELLKGQSVSIKGERIAYVGEDAGHTIGSQTEVIDASGKILIPGLIDGHAHILGFLYSPHEFLRYAMCGGTTTIITETMEIAFPLGHQGIIEFLESVKSQPIKIFATVPSMVTISPSAEAEAIDTTTMRELLSRADVLGLGETYWSNLYHDNHQRVLDLMAEALATGKRLEGHSAGARDNKLASYVTTGVTSCHEPTTVEETLERLRFGLHAMIREGDIRMELPEIAGIKDRDIDLRRATLCTDGIAVERLVQDGFMEFVLQRAIDFGIDPIRAVQMATLNTAEHFRIDDSVGGIAPGKYADILMLPDLKTIKAEVVISNGRIIARNGEVEVAPHTHKFAVDIPRSVKIDRQIVPKDFAISTQIKDGTSRVRVMDFVAPLVTREKQMDMVVSNGEIKADTERDILKIAVLTTVNGREKIFTGLVKGSGLKEGAFAVSDVWDACALLVVGANDYDMAEAINRIVALKGGLVVSCNGNVQAELALPVGGIMSEEPMETIVEKFRGIKQSLATLGSLLSDPHLSLLT